MTGNSQDQVGTTNPTRAVELMHDEIARVRNQPSPQFPYSNSGTISSGASLVISFINTNDPASQYAPFDTLKIVNSSTQPVYLYFGEIGSNYDLVPANYTATYNKQDMGGGVSKIKIYNAGTGDITAKQVLVTAWKVGTTPTDTIQGVQRGINRWFGANPFRWSNLLGGGR